MNDFKMFYYGCVDRAGHYLWSPNGDYPLRRRFSEADALPWGAKIDGGLCPQTTSECLQGVALLHVAWDALDVPWTAVSFWDNSVDSRPGSCSTFIVEGAHTFEQVMVLAKVAFPTVWSRFTFPIVQLEHRGAP